MKTISKTRLPKSLQEQLCWFVTGPADDYGPKKRYSPRTLADLRWNEPSDFTNFDEALKAVEENVWLDAVSVKIAKPYVAVAVLDAIAKGKLSKYFRPLAEGVAGYWEKRTNGRDVLGILHDDLLLPTGFGWFRGFLLYVCNDGLWEMSGDALSGMARDPKTTNTSALRKFFYEARWDRVWVPRMIAAYNERHRREYESQIAFPFDDD